MKMDAEVLRTRDTFQGRAASDVAAWRNDFPILRETVRGKPLVYLDNAATTHKPQSVIDAEMAFYRHTNANVHRGVHALSQRATDQYEGRARRSGVSSTPPTPGKSCSCAAPPRRSTWWRKVMHGRV